MSRAPGGFQRYLCLCLCASALLHGQSQPGEIRVEVKDASGAVMQASGKIENTATGVVLSFQTDAQGLYRIEGLAAGAYRVEISRRGFASQTMSIEVAPGASVSQAVTLAVSAAASSVDVVATTPLAGSDLSLREIPSPAQTVNQQDIDASGARDLSDFLDRRLSGVNVNENQGSPFQPDVNYRGYTASPLLGTPQGVSVYMDEGRQNQPFGDVVSWDLIPRIAIAEVALVPGSNPMFGLNTLGGAVSIGTKDGRSQPGTTIQVSGGSFGRRAAEFEHGGSNAKGLNWYVAGNLFHEDGWRIASPSDVRQVFGKLGWQGAKATVALSFAYADNSL